MRPIDEDRLPMDLRGKIKCPKCGQVVDRVDGEYQRHYVVLNIICTTSMREIHKEPDENGKPTGNTVQVDR